MKQIKKHKMKSIRGIFRTTFCLLASVLCAFAFAGENIVHASGTPSEHVHDGRKYSGELWLSTNGGTQGTAAFGDYIFWANAKGEIWVYNTASSTPGKSIGKFKLGSYNSGTFPEGEGKDGFYSANKFQNHSNQMMFGRNKFAENDPFPLLYVTTGNCGGHDSTGAYIAKCAVERIYFNGKKWSSETIQTIEFNDFENIPEENGNPYKNQNALGGNADSEFLRNMYDRETGKFFYSSGNGYDSSKGYQKVGWGWPAFLVDAEPTAVTEGKLFIYSARFRTYGSYAKVNSSGYGDDIVYSEDNAYIFTEFDLPALPTSESDPTYGGTVTLYPKDITNQFETEYNIGGTQGGNLYRGKLYWSYGFKASDNGVQIFDIKTERLTATYFIGSLFDGEPECFFFCNGVPCLSKAGNQIYSFGMMMESVTATDATCDSSGTIAHAICNICDKKFSLDDYKTELTTILDPEKPALGHITDDCTTPRDSDTETNDQNIRTPTVGKTILITAIATAAVISAVCVVVVRKKNQKNNT